MAALLTGCVDLRTEGPLISARLYLGLTNAAGAVPPAEFNAFLDTVVTPKFPTGLTVFHTDGQWRGPDNGVVKERSVVLELIFTDDQTNRENLFAIIDQYKQRFRQFSVLLVISHDSINYR
ncbi:MAG TPA: DUF3574 domain-containing protein [Planctomycetota bacterium]|nr:DUF3574 domain-containing protein [Planctomycetota bacterium]